MRANVTTGISAVSNDMKTERNYLNDKSNDEVGSLPHPKLPVSILAISSDLFFTDLISPS